MWRLGGVEPALTPCAQPSRVRFLARAAWGPGSGRRRPVSSSRAPPRSASSPRPVASARAAADTRNVWAGGLTGCVGAHQPAVRGGSSATQPAASPEPACWPAFRRPRCCWAPAANGYLSSAVAAHTSAPRRGAPRLQGADWTLGERLRARRGAAPPPSRSAAVAAREVQRAQDASGEEFCPKTPLWRGRPLLRCSPRPRAGQVLWPL